MRRLHTMRSHKSAPLIACCRSFWGGWGGKEKAAPKPKTPSAFSRIVPHIDVGSKKTTAVPKGSMSMAEALNPARVAAAIDMQSGETPDPEQQRLIDAGLELLEHAKRIDTYSIPQIEALDALSTLVFSDTLSATLPVYEQFQLIIDAVFLFCEEGAQSSLAKPLLSILSTFLPPDVVVVFEDLEVVKCLRTEEERLGVCSCIRLSMGEEFEAVGERLKGAVAASTMVSTRGSSRLQKVRADEETGFLLLSALSDELQSAVLNLNLSERANADVMQRLFNILLDQHPGLRDHRAFANFAKCSAHRLRLQCEYVQLLARLFSAFDPEGTGKISFEMLKSSLVRVSSPQQAEQLLTKAHPDEEGMIAYPVLLRMLREVR